ncbi:DNA-binding FadR family transcriptional regulator [Sphingomonas zeicaulis]|uniref:FadR/GntR family transcriptional regulator n=1 Tax=Sphingomonas zeicaulis TaxID=1632740 RepID=UPI003D25F85C
MIGKDGEDSTGSLTDMLFARLEAGIRSGIYPPGSKLPSQKEIAEDAKVSRTVVREAVARLAAKGVLVSRQGSGVFVEEVPDFGAFQIAPEELHELADVIRLLEIRLAVETEMAGLAAARRTTADITAMKQALDDMAAYRTDPTAAAEADARFHAAVARSTQNDYFPRIIDFIGVRLVPRRTLLLRGNTAGEQDAYAAKVLGEHEAIFDAIVRMESAAARHAARQHMQESLTRHQMLAR